jgi:glycosyltransferase involved in cell wall biosynthesis
MNISVLIPTYRRPQDLCRCLEALKNQTRPADEILVIVRDSDAETRLFIADFDAEGLPLKIVTVTVPGVVAAMNNGLAEATGDIIALTDDDTAPYPDWLERIAAHFVADEKLGGIGGRDWQPVERGNKQVVGIVQWHGRVIGNHHLGAGAAREVDNLKGANCAFRAKPLKDIGFETRLRGEGAQVHWELNLCLAMKRRGWKLVYDPAVAIDHFPAQRFDDDLLTRAGDNFSANALYNAVHNETLALWQHLSPPRRIAFLVWAVFIGTIGNPGLLQTLRLLALRRSHIFSRFRAAMAGRFAAVVIRKNAKANSTRNTTHSARALPPTDKVKTLR